MPSAAVLQLFVFGLVANLSAPGRWEIVLLHRMGEASTGRTMARPFACLLNRLSVDLAFVNNILSRSMVSRIEPASAGRVKSGEVRSSVIRGMNHAGYKRDCLR